ncbi:hypothetical protein C7121_28905 [Paenibacillus glucanolyticus]|uniref:Uncharacterized protein n=1 Tax=Paenibacillus glucanolyticus TaxID=59843 RepID=A0A163KRS4_9BACL|nr:hypothetical protein A3958_16145 [Paenibacillus glucanolyticus]AWP29114.1 hypothetical protein B9D94_21955 [Paenibacillus sp. Cedars]ETT35650.1 hypothetical protein C169_16619 [Paenibacillus sp. FSL R5-808]MDH6674786.1 hypothetical protein [Paenibacillus sp. LBL]AVV59859.1 hypothetical protein C7121_28905 [Paenibacillus glucanolyticus]
MINNRKHETKVVPRENSLSSFEDEGLFLFHAKNAIMGRFSRLKHFWLAKLINSDGGTKIWIKNKTNPS